ncbi:MAG: exodeoxyribonuclease III [Clostridiales bacterium]|nr:exodeoxyribonuclease III [Clostridiales bacterium]
MTKRFVSWNVNGIRAAIGKGFYDSVESLNPDVLCLQETKVQPGQVEVTLNGYHQYWNYAEKKGYSGTAVFTKEKPLSVKYGIGIDIHDKEGRVISLEFKDYWLVTVYTPNSKDGLLRLDYRMQWEDDFFNFIRDLEKTKPVIYCGDLNVAHEEIDLKNPSANRRNAGFTDEEREKISHVLSNGYIDTFRFFYPDMAQIYSWWSYRFHARENNAGWRIDYFIASDKLKPALRDAKIHNEIYGSDHCPVELIIEV